MSLPEFAIASHAISHHPRNMAIADRKAKGTRTESARTSMTELEVLVGKLTL